MITPKGINIQEDDKIVVAGLTDNNPSNFAIVRLESEPVSSIAEAKTDKEYVIYPNPAEGSIVIQNRGEAGKPFSYEVVDLVGRIALSGSANFGNNINVSQLREGCYIIIIRDDKGRNTQKKIVKK